MSDHWREKLSTFFSEEELDEVEEWNLQKRLVQALYADEQELQALERLDMFLDGDREVEDEML